MTFFLIISVLLYGMMTWIGLRSMPDVRQYLPAGMLSHVITTLGFLILYLWGSWLLILRFCY